MGGEYGGSAPNYGLNIDKVMKEYIKYLPQLAQVTSQAQPGIDLSQAKSAAGAAPIYNQATLDMYGKYAPALNAIGQQIGASNAQTGQKVTTSMLGSPDAAAATASANSLERQANPEFYATRELAGSKLADLMNSINLNGLSGSERAEVERSLGQSQTATGNLGLDNATNAVSNAMTFGNAMQGKRDALASAINTATNYLPQSKTSFDPVSLALGQNPSVATSTGTATGQFGGVTPAGNQSFSMGNNMFSGFNNSDVANMGMQYQANRDKSFAGILASQTGAIGNVCCFIFLEALDGFMPWWVRDCRDKYYNLRPRVASGYKKMARWLVPLMQKSPTIRWAVWRWMVEPLTLYGGFVKRVDGYQECRRFKSYRKFWFTIWSWMGKDNS